MGYRRLALLQGWEWDTELRFAPFDERGQGLDGDEEHLGEGEGGTYFRTPAENLFVCPDIPGESKAGIRKGSTNG